MSSEATYADQLEAVPRLARLKVDATYVGDGLWKLTYTSLYRDKKEIVEYLHAVKLLRRAAQMAEIPARRTEARRKLLAQPMKDELDGPLQIRVCLDIQPDQPADKVRTRRATAPQAVRAQRRPVAARGRTGR